MSPQLSRPHPSPRPDVLSQLRDQITTARTTLLALQQRYLTETGWSREPIPHLGVVAWTYHADDGTTIIATEDTAFALALLDGDP